MKQTLRHLNTVSFAAALIASAALAATAASVASAAQCPPPPASVQPFLPWSDSNDYVPTTGGSFEPGQPAWSLSGGASVVNDNAPNALDPKTDGHALHLTAGSSVTSACVTAPGIIGIVRFFAKSNGGQLKVEVLVKGGVYDAGTITAGSHWSPSAILTSNAPAYKGAVTYQIRLTAVGADADFTIDDVYFDPWDPHSRPPRRSEQIQEPRLSGALVYLRASRARVEL
jgi:hypothetical protein